MLTCNYFYDASDTMNYDGSAAAMFDMKPNLRISDFP